MVNEKENQTDDDRDDEFEGSEVSSEWDDVNREKRRNARHPEDDDNYRGY